MIQKELSDNAHATVDRRSILLRGDRRAADEPAAGVGGKPDPLDDLPVCRSGHRPLQLGNEANRANVLAEVGDRAGDGAPSRSIRARVSSF